MTRDSALSTTELAVDEAVEAATMDEESFRAFYTRTARPLWAYLVRVSGDRALADDLLQETYCRFFTSRAPEMTDAHRKNYLFRIALNLLRDHWRRNRNQPVFLAEPEEAENLEARPSSAPAAAGLERGPELGSALERVKPRERELLWLAYVEGFSHKEIAEMTGLRAASLRPMLFRARKTLARLLGRSPGRDSACSPETKERGVKP